jgi:hypothetical protein
VSGPVGGQGGQGGQGGPARAAGAARAGRPGRPGRPGLPGRLAAGAHLVVVALLHLQRLSDRVRHLQAALQRLGGVVVLSHHDAAQQGAIGAGLHNLLLLLAARGRGALGRRGPEGQHGLLQTWG